MLVLCVVYMRYVISILLMIVSIGALFSNEESSSFSELHRPIIVFDFGGVVGGTDRTLVAQTIAHLLGISSEEALCVISELRLAKELGISQQEFWENFEIEYGRRLPKNWNEQYEEIRMLAIRANPQMLIYVDSLRKRGYRVALLSNVTEPRAEFIRKQGFYRHFEPVVLSCEIGVSKPHKEAFVTLLNQLGASARDCIMIDDKPENIAAARRLGIDGIIFSSVDDLGAELEKRGIY